LMVLYGGFGPSTAGVPRPHGMPPFVLALNNAEIAAVISHVRTTWGNRATPVSEFEVNTVRNIHSPG
jgi:mono/diheme cytochrome c family protein